MRSTSARDEPVVDAGRDDEARGGRAALAGGVEGALHRAFDGRLSGPRRPAPRAGSCRPSRAGTLAMPPAIAACATRLPVDRAGEGDRRPRARRRGSPAPTTEPRPITRLNTPGGRPARLEDLRERPGAARHEVGGLEHHAVAVGERRRDLPGRDRDREVPRRDHADHAERLARDLDVDAGRTEASFSPGARSASPAKNLKIWPARADLADALGQRLALLAREQVARARPCGRGSRCRRRRERRSAPAARPRPRPGTRLRAPRRPLARVRSPARAYSPTTSVVSDGLMFGVARSPSTHSPPIQLRFIAILPLSGSRARASAAPASRKSKSQPSSACVTWLRYSAPKPRAEARRRRRPGGAAALQLGLVRPAARGACAATSIG